MKFYILLLLFSITLSSCKHEIVTTNLNDPKWENCFKDLQFPNNIKSNYYIEGYLDNKYFVISDNIDGFKMYPDGHSIPYSNKILDKLQSDTTRLYGNANVSFSKEFGINLNMPAVYHPFDGFHLLKGYPDYKNITLDKLKIGNLPIGNSYDGKSFSITVNSKQCYFENSPYPKTFVATSAWGEQSNSYIRLINITKRTGVSLFQNTMDQKLSDYELEFEFSINLFKDPEGKHLWKKLTNGKMKCVLSFLEF
jgi:hypothetical protein